MNSKLTLEGDVVLWDGDQVAFLVAPNVLCLCLSSEDLANAEVSASKKEEILENKSSIINELKSRGFSFENEEE